MRPKLGIGILVYILSIILITCLNVVAMSFGFIKSIYNRHFIDGIKTIDFKLWHLGIMVDQIGNIVCSELFDALLIKSESTNKFGTLDETVSSVLGKNQKEKTLTKAGWWLVGVLDKIEKDHCLKSIKN